MVRDRHVRTTQPFTFDFSPDQITLSKVTLSGEATELTLVGTIGLSGRTALSLDVNGRIDLALLSATEPDWVLGGAVSVQGRIRGTPQNPNLSGVAHLTTASLGKKGVFTNISALNGDLFFDGNRATLSNVEGHIGGGTLRLQGTALIQQEQIQGMNIQIESKGIRLEYPTGLRTVVDGNMALRGSWGSPFVAGSVQVQSDRVVVNERVTDQSPLLEGNIQIQSMSYRNDFEQFLQTFQAAEGFERDDSPRAACASLCTYQAGEISVSRISWPMSKHESIWTSKDQ